MLAQVTKEHPNAPISGDVSISIAVSDFPATIEYSYTLLNASDSAEEVEQSIPIVIDRLSGDFYHKQELPANKVFTVEVDGQAVDSELEPYFAYDSTPSWASDAMAKARRGNGWVPIYCGINGAAGKPTHRNSDLWRDEVRVVGRR